MNYLSGKNVETASTNANVQGVVLFSTVEKKQTKNGGDFYRGDFRTNDGYLVSFKVWGNSDAFGVISQTKVNEAHEIKGRVDDYNGMRSIVIEAIGGIVDVSEEDFLPNVYNIDAYWNSLVQMVDANVSDKGKAIAHSVLFDDTSVAERFKKEFAGKSHHDNCKGGLLAHTYKVVMDIKFVIDAYFKGYSDDYKDLLILGSLFHDIGKIDEMKWGNYTEESCVTHRILGLKYLNKHKDEIVNAYGNQWFIELCSIMVQHHDEFGDPAQTVPAYIVHLCDLLESKMQILKQDIEAAKELDQTAIKLDDRYLQIF